MTIFCLQFFLAVRLGDVTEIENLVQKKQVDINAIDAVRLF